MSYHPQSHTITFEAALRDLESKNHKNRWMAAHALGDVTDPDKRKLAADALIKALKDDRPEVRAEAALALGDLELELAVEPLVGRLSDMVGVARQAAAIALGKLGFASGFEPLAELLREGGADLRFQAATSLVEIDADRALAPLLDALEDETDGEVLGAIALGLGTIGDEKAIAPLKPLVKHERKRTRFDAAYALAQLGCDAGVEVLGECGADSELGWDAMEAIELIGGDAAADATIPLLKRRKLERPQRMRAAAALLASSPDHAGAGAAQDILTAGLKAWKPEHRGLAVELLAKVGGRWAIEPLKSLRGKWGGRRFADEIDETIAAIEARGGL